jgi:hypothetical protein
MPGHPDAGDILLQLELEKGVLPLRYRRGQMRKEREHYTAEEKLPS